MPDKFDRICKASATMDAVSPAISIAKSMINVRSTVLYIDAYSGFSVNDIKRILNQQAIENWGGDFSLEYDMIVINVKNDELPDAKRTLESAGVTLIHTNGWNIIGCLWLIPLAGLIIWMMS